MSRSRRWALPLALALALGACTADQPVAPPPPYEPTPEEQSLMKRLTARQSLNEYDEGVAEAEAFLATHPTARRVNYAVGVLHGLADRHEQALAAFERELALDPTHLSSYRGSATAHTMLGQSAETIEKLRLALAVAPERPDVQLELGRALSNSGQLEEAELLLRQAVTSGGGAPALVELGILQRRQGQLEPAVEAFEAALKRDPNELGAMVNLGQTLSALGRTAEGQAMLRHHAQQAALNDRLDIYLRSSLLEGATAANFIELALLQIQTRRLAEAVESYRRALELDPKSTAATLGLATLFHQDGQATEATKWTVHTLLIDPTNSKAHFLLGMQRIRKGQIEPALESFAASRRHQPWQAEAYWRTGNMLRASSHLDLADRHYREALTLDPSSAPAHYGLGFSQLLQGQPTAAVISLRRAIELDPTDADSKLLLGLAQAASSDQASAEESWQSAAALHRLDLLTGKTLDQLLKPFATLNGVDGASAGLERYRGLVTAE